MDLDDVWIVSVVAPDLGKQLVLGKHQAAPADKVGEQPELGRGQLERRAGPRGQAGLFVDDDLAGFDRCAQAARSPKYSAHAGEQFFEREGLDQVVVGTEFEAAQSVRNRVATGQENDRQSS